ncbi:MAG: peptidoglycan DD-metalloendopeptidase family protein [Lachnospiraceae bacterium]|nr:peptidoglycan DD-metalloendopeptidase family protein [Lachnospiraceae bacterium]
MRDVIITSSILIIAILAIRYLAKDRLHPMLQYALWIPVVLRLLLPMPLWNSPVSILNLLPEREIIEETVQDNPQRYNIQTDKTIQEPVQNSSAQDGMEALFTGEILPDKADTAMDAFIPADASESGRTLMNYLPYIWLGGILLIGGYMLFIQIKWKRYLYANRKEFRNGEKYRGILSVYVVPGLPSPCLTGSSIYLTEEMTGNEEQLAHILAHEYCHYKQLDSIWVIVRCVLTAVYWFHPLVWLAAYVSKQDSELACDAAVISLLGEEERIAYGKTLLKLISEDFRDRSRIGIASTMSGGENGIRERITRIARTHKYIAVVSGVVLLFIAALVAVTFSGKTEEGLQTDASSAEDDSSVTDTQLLADETLQTGAILEKHREELAMLEKEIQQAEAMMEERSAELAKLEEMDAELTKLEKLHAELAKLEELQKEAEYAAKGETALEEGMYLLDTKKGPNGFDIKVYGMYTKEQGCMGIEILVGETSNNFTLPWSVSYMHGLEENISVYAYTEDGMPKTFALKMPLKNTSDPEIWDLYLCDCDDKGVIELSRFRAEDYIAQMMDHLRLELSLAKGLVYVYDYERSIGTLGFTDVFMEDITVNDVLETVLDGSRVTWELGNNEDELKLITAVGLKLKSGEIRYKGLNLISFAVDCGSYGDRSFTLGKAKIEKELVSAEGQIPTDTLAKAFLPEEGHYDVKLKMINPCPSYTRISDGFGTRIHPVSGEVIVHNGVDLAAKEGSDVVAAAEGEVYRTGYDAKNGNYVVLYHGQSGEYTYYTGCKEILVSEGDHVVNGQRIATVGQTGMSTGSHLHFALSRDGIYVEPVFE